ncbi:hypothetical protein MRSL_11040 [Staphylococcus lugdunensis]|nr:hypothetical protein MRSL_11040 [Staphylococcus lugdunensis]
MLQHGWDNDFVSAMFDVMIIEFIWHNSLEMRIENDII